MKSVYKIPARELARRERVKPAPKDILDTKTSEEKAHATFSASGSERWLGCPGSIALSKKAPPQGESDYAAEGTKAHAVLEFLIKNRANRAKAVVFLRGKYPTPMIIHAEMALEEIEKRLREVDGAELHSEIRADLPVSEPGQYGTTDVAIIEHFGLLEIIDYKYGAGIPVPAKTSQLIYYALGIAAKFDFNFAKVRLTIIQPRAQIDGKFVRSHDMTIEELLEWRDTFEAGIKRAKKPDAPLIPSAPDAEKNYCRFCPAAVICPELGKKSIRQAQIDFNDDTGALAVPEIKPGVAIANLPKILAACDRIEEYIKAVRDHAFHVMKRGEKIEGFKLVGKRGTRKWNDVEKAEEFARKTFGDDAFDPATLKSPAQLEKLSDSAKAFVAKNTTNVSGGLTLVDESDPRPAVNPASDDFIDSEPAEPVQKSSGKTSKKTNSKR